MTGCKVCRHTQVDEINADLMANKSLRWVAQKYHLSKSTVERHKASCMAESFATARALALHDLEIAQASEMEAEARVRGSRAAAILTGVEMAEKLNETIARADYLYDQALVSEDFNVAVRALDLNIKVIREYTKLAAEAREREKLREERLKTEWATIRAILIKILDKYPEVKADFDDQLSRIGSKTFA